MTNLHGAIRQLLMVLAFIVALAVVSVGMALAKPPAHVEAKHNPAPVAVAYEYEEEPGKMYGHPECWGPHGKVNWDRVPPGHQYHDPDVICP